MTTWRCPDCGTEVELQVTSGVQFVEATTVLNCPAGCLSVPVAVEIASDFKERHDDD